MYFLYLKVQQEWNIDPLSLAIDWDVLTYANELINILSPIAYHHLT